MTQAGRGFMSVLTFIVAAVGGVIGNHVSGKLTPALVVFLLLLAAGAVFTYFAGRGNSSTQVQLREK